MRTSVFFCSLLTIVGLATAAKANLLVNGSFELTNNGFSSTATPVGWTNVGHADGVIAYSTFGTPAFDGTYYYDLGGFGGALPASGDGIQQTVATVIGKSYILSFGFTNENGPNGDELLNVLINGSLLQSISMISDGSVAAFRKPFETRSVNYVATTVASTITFTVGGTITGNRDPLIDRVDFDTANVPEPGTWAVCIAGLSFLVASRIQVRRA